MRDTSEDTYKIIRGLCDQLCQSNPARFRVAKNEANDSSEFVGGSDEFLKVDEIRVGRDFRLYGLMAIVSSRLDEVTNGNAGTRGGIGNALADFALQLLHIKHIAPDSFEAVRTTVESWQQYFPGNEQQWLDLWKNGGAS